MTKLNVQKVATLEGHKDSIYTIIQGHTPHLIYSSGGDGMVVSWDLTTLKDGELIAKVPNSVYSLHLYENQLIAGHNFEGLHWLNPTEKKEISSIKCTDERIFDIQSTSNYIIVATGKGKLLFLNHTLQLVKEFQPTNESVRAIAIHPQQHEVAVGFSDNIIRIINLDDLTIIKEIEGHKNSIFALTYTKDNQLLSTGRDAHIIKWDHNYEEVKRVAAHMYTINHIALHPNGKYFATCSMDKSIKIWRTSDLKLLKVIDKARHAGHGTSVNKLVWSTYNDYIVSASDDRTISVWQLNLDEYEDYTS